MKSLTKIFYFHAIDTLFSVSELVNNAKDFETAKITTPVRSGLLWKRLRSYKHRATISRGFRDGFRIGVDRHNIEWSDDDALTSFLTTLEDHGIQDIKEKTGYLH